MNTGIWSDFFTGHAPEYEDNCFTKNTLAEVDFLERELALKPGAAILDIGCGTGRHSIELAKRGCRVTGLDLTPAMLDVARQHAQEAGVEVRWIESDAQDFSFDAEFDAVICLCEGAFGLLSSVDDPIEQPLAILRNASQAMKPGAPCLFTVLSAFRLARKATPTDVKSGAFDPLTLSERTDVPTEVRGLRERGFVPTELRLLFSMAGLNVQHIWGGTAGNWGKRAIDLDEYELMVVARK